MGEQRAGLVSTAMSGRRALVTGGSRNLGPAIAVALARRGATVAVNHRDSGSDAARVVAELNRFGGGHLAVQADLMSSDAVARMVETVVGTLGGLEIVVNNLGPYDATATVDLTEAQWDRVVDGNLKAAWLCARAAAPHMRRAGWGRVVNLSAVSASARNRGAYGLAKAAVEVLTEELALELAPFATVNAVAPGQVRESLDELAQLEERWAAEVTERTPARRLVTRDEVGEVVAMLCGEAFDAMTGATLPLDGGLRIARL